MAGWFQLAALKTKRSPSTRRKPYPFCQSDVFDAARLAVEVDGDDFAGRRAASRGRDRYYSDVPRNGCSRRYWVLGNGLSGAFSEARAAGQIFPSGLENIATVADWSVGPPGLVLLRQFAGLPLCEESVLSVSGLGLGNERPWPPVAVRSVRAMSRGRAGRRRAVHRPGRGA